MTKKPNILLSCMTALIVCLVPVHAATDAASLVAPKAGPVPPPLAARESTAETAADVALGENAMVDASVTLTAATDVAEQTLTLAVLEQEYGTVTGADIGANTITKDSSCIVRRTEESLATMTPTSATGANGH